MVDQETELLPVYSASPLKQGVMFSFWLDMASLHCFDLFPIVQTDVVYYRRFFSPVLAAIHWAPGQLLQREANFTDIGVSALEEKREKEDGKVLPGLLGWNETAFMLNEDHFIIDGVEIKMDNKKRMGWTLLGEAIFLHVDCNSEAYVMPVLLCL